MKLHFNLGQFVSLALLGLSAYEQQDKAGSGGPSVFLNPNVIAPYLQGVVSVFQAHPDAFENATPAAPGTQPAAVITISQTQPPAAAGGTA